MTADWNDLQTRIISAAVLASVGLLFLSFGGFPTVAFIAVLAGAIVWEALTMTAPGTRLAVIHAALAGGVFVLTWYMGGFFVFPLFGAVVVVILQSVSKDRELLAGAIIGILLAAYAFLWLRFNLGLIGVLWLVLVIVASDVGGYFCGRMFGGPKFMPEISPKKTWSGTIAGWVGAALIGLIMAPFFNGSGLIFVSVLVAFAGQMGDIAESAIKRRMNVKDSSQLIPGHGGVWDRFDSMLAGALMTWALSLLGLLPVTI